VLWGVGPVTTGKLAEAGVTTVGQLAQVSEEELRARFGRHGAAMARQARGIDDRPVVTEHETKSVSQEQTFARDISDAEALKGQVWRLSQGVSRRLKKAGLAAGTVAIKLRYADFTTLTRQMTLTVPTDDEREIYRAALALLKRAWDREEPVRLLGVAGRHLSPPPGQLSLW
jgi:DNA polymerase-4